MGKEVSIKLVLEKHKKWLDGKEDGECADLRNANLGNADLWNADLRNADLRNPDLRNAEIWNADLGVKTPPVNSHYFIAEILFRESKNFKERSWAGSIMISTDWCWNDFLNNCPKSMILWAKKILCDKWPEFEENFK